jgi:DNA repair protein RadC
MENKNHQSINYQASEIQLIYKTNVKPSDRPKVTVSQEAYQVFFKNWDQDKIEFVEQFKVMLLNRAHKVLGIFDVSSGGVAATIADPKLIFGAAIKANACGIIVAHNHPSGNLRPSNSDIELTKKLRQGGRLLEIEVLDHIIVTKEGYFSMTDEGII